MLAATLLVPQISFAAAEPAHRSVFHKNDSSRILVVALSSCDTEGPEFKATVGRLRESEHMDTSPNCLFISQPRSWYLYGFETLLAEIREAVNAYGQPNCFFVGSSMGGWGALLFSSYFADAHVIAFSPQTIIDQAVPAWMRFEAEVPPAGISDIKSLVANRTGAGQTHVYVSSEEFVDLSHALRLTGVGATEIRVIRSDTTLLETSIRDCHNLAGMLAFNRCLTPILQAFIAKKECRSPICPDQPNGTPVAFHVALADEFDGSVLDEFLLTTAAAGGILRPEAQKGSELEPSEIEKFRRTLRLHRLLRERFTLANYLVLLNDCESLVDTTKMLSIYEHASEMLGAHTQSLSTCGDAGTQNAISRTKLFIQKIKGELIKDGFLSLADQLEAETAVIFNSASSVNP